MKPEQIPDEIVETAARAVAMNKQAPPSAKVIELAARLRGTCDSGVDEIEDLTVDECKQLDRLVFCCEQCNWWFEHNEMGSGKDVWKCRECAPSSPGDPT